MSVDNTNLSFNVVTNLSSIQCKPVSFNLIGNEFATYETPIVFNNGLRINIHECLKNCLSYKSNNKTSLFLTDLTNNNSILIDNTPPLNVGNFTEIDSPLTNQTAFHTPAADDNQQVLVLSTSSITSPFFQLSSSSLTSINESNVFRFVFQPDDTVVVQSVQNSYYLTSFYQTQEYASLAFQPRIIPLLSANKLFVDQQRFDYALGPKNITLYQIADDFLLPRFNNAVLKLNSGFYACSSLSYLTSASKFPSAASINFISYKESPALNSDIKDSFLAKYNINPLINQSSLSLNLSTRGQKYSQNYLGIFPTEYYIDALSSVKYPLAIHGLKNYQTPEYNYSFGFDYVPNQQGIRRKYETIHTGTNQDKGLDNVYLGYTSDTIEINFKPDQETGFYFGPASTQVPLSSVGLIEDGAIAGEVPFTADRIYLKQKNYNELIPDSTQPSNIPIQDNTWLCSWLYGTMSGTKVWMDRYYNAAYYNTNQALSSKFLQYNDKLITNKNYIYDIPSQMVLSPGVLYKYFHTGRKNRLNFIQHLSSNSILQITNWDSSPLIDESPKNGQGILYFNDPSNLKIDYLNLDGSNHVLFPATTDLLSESKISISMFVNVSDWNKIDGNQIFGNYYNSGFGLINDSSLTTPIITLVDNQTLSAYNINYRFASLSKFTINTENDTNGNKIIQRLPDFSYWIFDTVNKTGVKYDWNNEIITTINSNLNPNATNALQNNLKYIDQIEIDQNENLYLFSKDTKGYVILSTLGTLKAKGILSNNTNTIQISLNFDQITLTNNIIPCFGNKSAIDSNNNTWEIVGGNLYINKNIFGNVGNVQQIKFDSDDYLWILSEQDTVSKIDTVNKNIIFSYRIGKNSTLPINECFDYSNQTRFMSFIRVPKDKDSDHCNISTSKNEDRVLIIDTIEQQLYMLSIDGNLLTKLNLVGLTNNLNANMLSSGDFTGYEYLRRINSVAKKLNWKLLISEPNSKNQKLLSLMAADLSNISDGWHHFSLVFDSQNGYVNSYIDSVLIDSQTFTPNKYQLYYNYRTSLLLGCQSIANTTINDVIQIDDGYKFIGQVAELRLYNKSLTQGEIEQLFLSSKYASNDRTLKWNMSVGDRNYIEQIKYWYKMQMPGSKSKYFNINIHNLSTTDTVKTSIESSIKSNILKIAPANSTLYKINWK